MNQLTGLSNPFFSIVIPVYNKEKYLANTVESVLNQSFHNFELIIVLDPSTDRSSEIAESFNDSRIMILKRTTPGPGGYAARNLGVMHARANWIAFQDADDLWKADHLMLMWKAISVEKINSDIVCTGYCNERNGNLSECLYYNKFYNEGCHYFDFERFLLYKPISTINFAVMKSALIKAGGFPENKFDRGGDYETWLRVFFIIRKGYWINSITAIYNKNVTDGVIKTTVPLTYSHPVFLGVKEILKIEKDENIIAALKKYSNSFVKTGVRFNAKAGCLTKQDIKALYPEMYNKQTEYFLLKMISSLPISLQRLLCLFYGYLK